MIKFLGTSVRPLTPELAKEFATMDSFAGERSLKKRRLNFLKGKLDNGLFYSPKWAVARLNGKRFRVNGQHSSLMLAESNGSFPHGMEVTIDEFELDDDHDLAKLFSQFDAPTSSRNAIDIAGAHGRIHSSLAEFTAAALRVCTAGIAYAMSHHKETPVSVKEPDEQAALIHENLDFVAFAKPFVNKIEFKRQPVMAAMFITFRKSPEDAKRFWDYVDSESHPDNTNPTRVFAKFIRTEALKSKRNLVSLEGRAFFVKSIHAWNAFRKGNRTDMKYFPDSDLPDVL